MEEQDLKNLDDDTLVELYATLNGMYDELDKMESDNNE